MFLVDHYQKSPSSAVPLRVGVLLDGDDLIQPFADVLTQILGSNHSELAVRIYNASAAPRMPVQGRRAPFPIRLARYFTSKDNRQHFLWNIYEKLDARHAARERAVLKAADISSLLTRVPRLDVTPITKGFVHRFPPEAIAAVQEYGLDVMIRFGFNIIRGDILKSARYGVWSYHHGDNDVIRGGPSPFWELVERHPCSGVMLQVLNEGIDVGYVLCKGLAPTEESVWVSKNRLKPYLLGSTFIIRKLFELHRDGFAALEENSVPPAPYLGKRKVYRRPSNLDMARFLASRLVNGALGGFNSRKITNEWAIALRSGGTLSIRKQGNAGLNGFHCVAAPNGRYYAAPFLFERQSELYCFFEDRDQLTDHGRIACARVTSGPALSDVRTVLETDCPMSHPFVFEDGGEVYMIPETPAAGRVDLYRASSFPFEWERISTLVNTGGIGTTLVKRDGYYWLFISVEEPPGAAVQTVLLHSHAVAGPYEAHKSTVVCADARYSRSAGRFLEIDGMLLRPSQDPTGTRPIHFRRVRELSTSRYQEETFMTVHPAAGWGGHRSYDRCGCVEVIGGKLI